MILYLKTAWMEFYSGQPSENLDPGGFRYLQDHAGDPEAGGERRNFKRVGSVYYGYAPFKNTLALSHLGAESDEVKFVDGIDVVFMAKRPKLSGIFVVGWYEIARLFSSLQAFAGLLTWSLLKSLP